MTDNTKIVCKVCGEEVHSIKIHLGKAHKDISLEEYQLKYPGAPILSTMAQEQVDRKQQERATKESTTAERLKGKQNFHEIFKLGDVPAAMGSVSKKPIPITVCEMPTDEQSLELIPDVDESYVFPIEKLKSLVMGIEMNIPSYAYGVAGVGKSTIWEQIAACTHRPMLRLQHSVNTEESHIVGTTHVVPVEDKLTGGIQMKTEFKYGPLPEAMINGWMYLADEYDRALPSVLSVYQAVLEGKPLYIKEAPPEMRLVRPHPDFRFVATGNTNGGGDDTGMFRATIMQDAATIERFGVVELIEYLPRQLEETIVKQKAGVRDVDAKHIIEFCTKIREKHPTDFSLTMGVRSAITIGKLGKARGSFLEGVKLAFANRLNEKEREAAIQVAQHIFGHN